MYINSWLFEILLAITLIMIHQTTSTPTQFAEHCSSNTMFANNSAYQTNLNILFRSLSSNATNSPSGYYQATIDRLTSESIYGQYLCLADQNTSSCHDCVTTATTIDLPKTYCPNRKIAIIWYNDCMVRYSNDSFSSKMDHSLWFMKNGVNITGNTTKFMETMDKMMYSASIRAAESGTFKKFATEFVNYSIFDNSIFVSLYGLVQCTPNLSPNDCYMCLNSSIQYFQLPELGARVWAPSCFVRYELYQFFNLSYLPSPTPTLLPSSASDPLRGLKGNKRAYKIWIIMVSVVCFMLSVTLAFGISRRKTRKKLKEDEGNGQVKLVDSLQLDFSSIQFATDNFSDSKRLGNGIATTVYKGVLSDGQEIVVKKLHKGRRDIELEFDNEILLSANLQHKNLVKLLGFCIEKDLRFLVYEFLPNGTLQGFLNDPVKRSSLDWQTWYYIISGLGRGLLYLHEDSHVRVIHRDLKPCNILLGAQMDPKISNFRTASLVQADQTRGDIRVVGTYGYMPLEYVQHGHSSIKSDVFSYGVILLEIITGHMINGFSDTEKEESLPIYVWRKWCDGNAWDVVDKALPNIQRHVKQIKRCVKIALLCVQEDPRHRPTMSTVMPMLNSDTVDIAEPLRPAALILNNMDLDSNCHTNQTEKVS